MPDWRAPFCAAFLGLTPMACSPRPPEGPSTGTSARTDSGTAVVSVPTLEATFRDVWLGKPPLAVYSFDVTLRNPSDEPRWMVLPSTFPYTGKDEPAPGGDEAEVQSFRLSSSPRVIIVHGVSGHFHAVRLPGRGTVTLRRLGIQAWWESRPPAVDLEVLVARELTVGGLAPAELVGEDPTCESGADVDAHFDAGHSGALKFWHPPKGDLSSVPVVFDVESRERISVPLVR